MKNNVNWDDILEVIHSKLNPLSYDTWFKETKLIGIKNNTMQIEVPMEFHKKILNQTYYDLIEEIVSTVTGTSYDIVFLSAEEIKPLEVLELDEVEEPENKNLNSNLKPEYTFVAQLKHKQFPVNPCTKKLEVFSSAEIGLPQNKHLAIRHHASCC